MRKRMKSKQKVTKQSKTQRGLKLKEGQYFAVFMPKKKESGRM